MFWNMTRASSSSAFLNCSINSLSCFKEVILLAEVGLFLISFLAFLFVFSKSSLLSKEMPHISQIKLWGLLSKVQVGHLSFLSSSELVEAEDLLALSSSLKASASNRVFEAPHAWQSRVSLWFLRVHRPQAQESLSRVSSLLPLTFLIRSEVTNWKSSSKLVWSVIARFSEWVLLVVLSFLSPQFSLSFVSGDLKM